MSRVPPILPIDGVPEKLLQAINTRFRNLRGDGGGTAVSGGTPGAAGPPGPPGASGAAPLAPNVLSPSTPSEAAGTLHYTTVGGLPRWYWEATFTLPTGCADIRRVHIVIAGLPEVLAIASTQFGTPDFPISGGGAAIAGAVINYTTPTFERDTVTFTYHAELWVENADSILSATPAVTGDFTVTGTEAPFGGGTAPIPPTIVTASASAYNVPYGNLWKLGFKIDWTAPAGDYSVRIVKIAPVARNPAGVAQRATIDTIQGPFSAGAITVTTDAVDSGQVVVEHWTIRLIPFNADNVAGAVTDIDVVATPSTISITSASELGPRTNIVPDDPSAVTQRGLLTTVKFTVTLSANQGGSTATQQVRAWIRYDRGSGAGLETILLGSFGVIGLGGAGLGTAGEFNIPSVWVSIKNMASPNTVKVICAIWTSDSMLPPTENLGVNTGSFPMAQPAAIAPGSNSASVDSVVYTPIPGGWAWGFHTISVTCPFGDPNFKAVEFTVQKVQTTGALAAATDGEGLVRTFAGSGASQTPYLNITVDYTTGLVQVTLLTAWTMPPETLPDGTANQYRRFLIRVWNVRQDNSKSVVSCWQSGAGPVPETTYAGDRLEIIPSLQRAGLTTGALRISFSGADTNVNVPYNGALLATGGVQPYTFTSGALPAGLSLSAGTGAITGTPTTAGTFTFTGTVTDKAGTTATTPSCTIVVGAAGSQVGITIAAPTVVVTFGSFGGSICPIFTGLITLPTGVANYSKLDSIWVFVVDSSNKSYAIAVVRNWGAASSINYSGSTASIIQTAADQTVSLRFEPYNADSVLMGTPTTVSGVTVKGSGNATLALISSASILETGPAGTLPVARYQAPPGGNTYTYVLVTVNYSQSQTTVPVFTVWHSFDNGATKKWFGWFQGKIANTSTALLNFFIPLGTNTYIAYVAPGATNMGDPVPATAVATGSISLSLGAPSATPGGSSILSIKDIKGNDPAADGSNIFMGTNSLGNPYAEVIIKCATPGNTDTNPFYYEVWVAWVNASGALVASGGYSDKFGWGQASHIPNDGTIGVVDLKIDYPSTDLYLEIRVYGRSRNWSAPVPPVASDAATTQMQWPSGNNFYRLHVGLPPGQAGANTGGTTGNTNTGLSILSNPSFEFSRPGQVMDGNNSNPGPGFMGPGWLVDTSGNVLDKVTVLGSGGRSGPQFVRIQGPNCLVKQTFQIQQGQPLYIQFYAQSNNAGGTNAMGVIVYWLNAAQGLISQFVVGTVTGPVSSWGLTSLIIPASSVPAAASLAVLAFQNSSSENTAGYWDIDDVVVQQVIQQTNNQQIQSTGSTTSGIPVGLQNNSVSTLAASNYGLDKWEIDSSDAGYARVVVASGPSGGSILALWTPNGSGNGIALQASQGGNVIQVYHAGVLKTGWNGSVLCADGVTRTVWNGFIVS
jgi:hypothetical protein